MIVTSEEHLVAIADPTLNYIFRNIQVFKYYGADTEYLDASVQDLSTSSSGGPVYSIDKLSNLIQKVPHRVKLSVFITCRHCASNPSHVDIAFSWFADIIQCKFCNRFLKDTNVTVPVAAEIEVYYP